MNQLHLSKRGHSVTTAYKGNLQRSGTLQDPTLPGLRVVSAPVPHQALALQPTERSPTFPLVEHASYDSLNMPFGFPSVPRVQRFSNPSKKTLPRPPQSPPPRPYTAAPSEYDDKQILFHFDPGIGQATGDQQGHSGNQSLPIVESEQEVRASLNSAVTTNSSYLDNSITERSSVLTKCSSVSDITIDHTGSPVSKYEGMTVDDAISMYAAGFTDDTTESEDEAETIPLPTNEEQRRARRIAEATSDGIGSGLLLPKPPFAAEQRSSAAIMSGDAARSSSPRPPSILPPTSERDCYGFYKATHHVTIDQYDAWNVPYIEVQNRRCKRWVSFMREHRLSADTPICFPERSPKTQRFIRKGIPPVWRGAAWFYYAGGNTILNKHPNLYSNLLTRANAGELSENDRELIERDLHRTFPDNIHFKPDPTNPSSPFPDASDPSSPFHNEPPIVSSLRHILHAFALHSPQIGYCQSLNFLAGMLLLFLPEEKAFWMLHIITTHYLPGTHAINLEGANVDLWVLMSALKQSNMPAVWAKLSGTGGGSDSYPQSPVDDAGPATPLNNARPLPSPRLPAISLCTTSWFMSLFIGTLPVETTLRVWDVLFYEGPRTIFRVALAIFKLGESQIKGVSDAMDVFQVVQALPRRMLGVGALLEVAFKKGRGGEGDDLEEVSADLLRGMVGGGDGEPGDGGDGLGDEDVLEGASGFEVGVGTVLLAGGAGEAVDEDGDHGEEEEDGGKLIGEDEKGLMEGELVPVEVEGMTELLRDFEALLEQVNAEGEENGKQKKASVGDALPRAAEEKGGDPEIERKLEEKGEQISGGNADETESLDEHVRKQKRDGTDDSKAEEPGDARGEKGLAEEQQCDGGDGLKDQVGGIEEKDGDGSAEDDVRDSRGAGGAQGGDGKPEVLPLGAAKEEEGEGDDGGEEVEGGEVEIGAAGLLENGDTVVESLLDEVGAADAAGFAGGGATALVAGPEGSVPDADGDGDGLRLRAGALGEGDDGGSLDVERSGGWESAYGAKQATVREALIGGDDGWEEEAVGVVAGRERDAEAIPGVAAETFVALGGPGVIGVEEGPGGVVEGGVGVSGIVAGMEAPQIGEGGEGFAIGEEGDGGGSFRGGGLGVRRCEGKEDAEDEQKAKAHGDVGECSRCLQE